MKVTDKPTVITAPPEPGKPPVARPPSVAPSPDSMANHDALAAQVTKPQA